MPLITEIDALGINILLSDPASRIVSLVPSQSELLYSLGLEEEVVGITRFCIHPSHWRNTKTRVGGTKDVRVERVKSLMPDLVIANREENIREQVEAIGTFCPVWTSDVSDLPGALEMIQAVGRLTGRAEKANQLAIDIATRFASIPAAVHKPKAAYFIWKDPWMAAGGDTFIHDMMTRCGFDNVFGARSRYPKIDIEELAALETEWILLSSEPYPFRERDLKQLEKAIPQSRPMLVDGEMFSWYGSRMLQSASYLAQLVSARV